MSIQAIALVLELELNDVSAKAVLIGLANHTSPEGQCFPSVRRLMRYTGLSERGVRTTIKRLENMGLVGVTNQPGKRSIYTLHLPTPAADAGVTPAGNAPHPGSSCTTPRQELPDITLKNQKEPSDAREDLSDDWKPSPSLVVKLDYSYPTVDIGEQVKAFILHNRAKGTVIRNLDAAFEAWMNRIASLKMPVKARAPVAGGPAADPATVARSLTSNVEFYIRHGKHEDAAVAATQLITAHCQAGDDSAGRKAAMLAIEQWQLDHSPGRGEGLESWAVAQWGKDWRKIDGTPKGKDHEGPAASAGTNARRSRR